MEMTTGGIRASDRQTQAPLRVLVDASCLKREQGGVRSYTLGLSRALAERDGVEVIVATPQPDDLREDAVEVVAIREDVEPPLRRALWRESRLRRLISEKRADAVI